MNRIILIGNLTRDPELRTVGSGISVCDFTIAVNDRRGRNQQGDNQQENTQFFRITAWRQLGENCAKYLAKGRKVYVSGPLNGRTYTGGDGTTRVSLEVTADEVEFLSSGSGGQQAGGGQADFSAARTPKESPETRNDGFASVNDPDDLPF